MNPPPASLAALSTRDLKDIVLSADPACLCDPELFTGPADPSDEPADEKAARIDAARDMCAECPVRLACRAWALRTRPGTGIWAGYTADELTAPSHQIPAQTSIKEVA